MRHSFFQASYTPIPLAAINVNNITVNGSSLSISEALCCPESKPIIGLNNFAGWKLDAKTFT
jgi:hypothetical protein